MADESVAARHRHHAGHVLLRGADSPPRPARIAAAASERRFAGFAWHGDCLRVQPAAVRGVVDFPGRSRDPYFAFVGVVATLSLAGTLVRQHAMTAQQTAETEKAQSAQSTESTESARSQAKSPEPTQEKSAEELLFRAVVGHAIRARVLQITTSVTWWSRCGRARCGWRSACNRSWRSPYCSVRPCCRSQAWYCRLTTDR